MQIITTKSELCKSLTNSTGIRIGFVPTMGALHQGHLSLVMRSKRENEVTVVSIFVNPTQFNDSRDLEKYPRTLDADINLLSQVGCDIVFAPTVDEMYPEKDTRIFNFGTLETVMEGRHRPGHFNGVAQIVSKLFDAVQPHIAYFGEKDFQQLAIIREMVKQLNYTITIAGCPIVRESSGLALSSRNMLLSAEEHKKAPIIYQILSESCIFVAQKQPHEVRNWVLNKFQNTGLDVEYFEIVDGYSLQPVSSWNESDYIVGCIAVFCGKIRLIDNIPFKR
ncbi:MAG: pantoate--beta-alanine ligase [Paludibacteraceae bacterium]|nr:pantoate--beta-alanine ligase [Paludibacteraceae bacterium]NLK92152.1 pantoate--beta-alanine ligase [Bacteroidales bacterium]MBP6435790.1 pantoate--beta-alanine ligase [Paludibacteraceae bacterium]MBP7219351.1 pantoate--beta-alanine ligase [Paludibacteraceae bacterium]MBP8627041.1 pantoate--beta-alanine ligase [Paludibacteraceae bacterium]